MVAVLACNQTRGGFFARPIAAPTARVESTRESMIARRFAGVWRQLTLRPARLITTSAPSTSRAQSPRVAASQPTIRQGARSACRLSTTNLVPRRPEGPREQGAALPAAAR